MKGVIVLLSGGMDSATLLWLAKREYDDVWALSFDYGQRHRVELNYARELSRIAGVNDHIVVELPVYRGLKGSALLNEELEIPDGEYHPFSPTPLR